VLSRDIVIIVIIAINSVFRILQRIKKKTGFGHVVSCRVESRAFWACTLRRFNCHSAAATLLLHVINNNSACSVLQRALRVVSAGVPSATGACSYTPVRLTRRDARRPRLSIYFSYYAINIIFVWCSISKCDHNDTR